MAWIEDLTPCTYFGHPAFEHRSNHDVFEQVEPADLAKLLAVGWLEGDHPFDKGDVSAAFREKLRELQKAAWQPCLFMGWHSCSICPSEPVGRHSGLRNLFVPADGTVYAAPELISHYIDDHNYAPPAVFIAAVLACPPMNSKAYFEALSGSGPPGLAEIARLAMSETSQPRDDAPVIEPKQDTADLSRAPSAKGGRLLLIGIFIIIISIFVSLLFIKTYSLVGYNISVTAKHVFESFRLDPSRHRERERDRVTCLNAVDRSRTPTRRRSGRRPGRGRGRGGGRFLWGRTCR